MGAHSGLATEHNGGGAVINGVSHIGDLCPGGAGIGDHRLQHLGSGHHHFAGRIHLANDHLLNSRDPLKGDFYAHITAGHHNAVRFFNNRVNVIDALHILDFSNNTHIVPAQRLAEVAQIDHISCGTHKGRGDKIKIMRRTEFQILHICRRQVRHVQADVRHIHALFVGEQATVRYPANDLVPAQLRHLHGDQAVVNEDRGAHFYIVYQPGVVHIAVLGITQAFFCGKRKSITFVNRDAVGIFKVPGANFRTLGIQQGSHRHALRLTHTYQLFQPLGLGIVITVTKVEPCHIHTGLNHIRQHLIVIRCRTEGANNFCFFHQSRLLVSTIPKFILPQNRQKATPATGFLHNLKITGFGSGNTGKKHKNSAAELWKIPQSAADKRLLFAYLSIIFS